jgi:hypothetical protein
VEAQDQLRAVLIGTPLCEVHGTARTDHHRQGTPFNPMFSDERAPPKGSKLPTPLRTHPLDLHSAGLAPRSSSGRGFEGSRDKPNKALFNLGKLGNLLD